MPLFETQFALQGKAPDGKVFPIPPYQSLRAMGPVLPVLVSVTKQHREGLIRRGQPVPDSINGLAIIDTGASATAVDESACKRLGLQPTGTLPTAHAGGPEIRLCYPIQISFPNTPLPPWTSPQAMSVNLQLGKQPYIVLFGRDLLMGLKFVYNGPAGRIELAY